MFPQFPHAREPGAGWHASANLDWLTTTATVGSRHGAVVVSSGIAATSEDWCGFMASLASSADEMARADAPAEVKMALAGVIDNLKARRERLSGTAPIAH